MKTNSASKTSLTQVLRKGAIILALLALSFTNAKAQYCSPIMFATNGCNYLNSVTTSGASTNITVPVDAGYNGTGYTYFSSPVISQSQGNSFTLSVQAQGYCSITYYFVWVDWNQDFVFDPSEMVINNGATNTGNTLTNFTINVPINATAGNTRMRILCRGTGSPIPTTACDNESSYYGETEDYAVTVLGNYDMGVLNLTAPASVACYTTTETVTATVKNFGAGTMNLSLNPVTVNCSVTGPNPMTFTPVVLNTGTIAPGGTQLVTISTTYNMSATGTYAFTTSTSVSGDATSGNDSYTQSYVKTPPPTVTANSTAAAVCAGGSVTLTGGGATTYSWSGGVTNAVPFVPVSTLTYTVTGTSASGCTNTATTTVTVNAIPTVTANSTAAAVCAGGSVTLSGGGATTYAWSGGVTNAVSFVPVSTLTYTVTGTSGSGCTNTATTTVTVNALPTVTASSTAAAVCAGGSVTLSGGGATTYTWTGGATNAVSFVPSSTLTYTVTGTDANSCINTATTTVTVNALPIVTANSTALAVCAGASVTLTGGGATSYTWTGGATDAVSFVPATTLTYTVTGTDANSCSNTATTTVTVNALPTVTANSTAAAVCAGGSVTLTGGGATTYAWDNSVIDGATFVPAATATYIVTGTDVNGCINTATTTVTVNALPIVTATAASSVVCIDDASVTLTGTPASGTWSGPGVTGSSFSPTTAGLGVQTATYTFTDLNSCTNTATATIQVNACTGVVENTLENGFNVYPNPNNGEFTISFNANVGNVKMEILDIQGRVVYSVLESNVQIGFTKQVSMNEISNGVYMIRVTSNEGQRMIKFSVMK